MQENKYHREFGLAAPAYKWELSDELDGMEQLTLFVQEDINDDEKPRKYQKDASTSDG